MTVFLAVLAYSFAAVSVAVYAKHGIPWLIEREWRIRQAKANEQFLKAQEERIAYLRALAAERNGRSIRKSPVQDGRLATGPEAVPTSGTTPRNIHPLARKHQR